MKDIGKMICKELKNLGDNLFSIKKRSVRKRSLNLLEDRLPLTEAMCNDDITSSIETITKYNTENEELLQEDECQRINRKLPFTDHNPIQTTTNFSKPNSDEKKHYSHSSKKQKKLLEVQKDWSFTWYDFDGRGKITKKDMSTVMKSLYDIIRHNAKNRNSRSIDQYRLHLVLMPTDLSNVQGLDLATSYDQIYKVNSVLTSLTNLSVVSSEDDNQDSDNTISNYLTKKEDADLLLKSSKKSFSGRCFEELQEMRARHKEKRSKSTPTNNFKRRTMTEDNDYFKAYMKSDKQSMSSSLMSLAGSSSQFQTVSKLRPKKSKKKASKSRHIKINSNKNDEFSRTILLSTSLQNLSLEGSENDITVLEGKDKRKHIKLKNKQKLKKDLGRMHVEEWLSNEIPSDLLENKKEIVHHYHHHYSKQSDGILPFETYNLEKSDIRNGQEKTFEYHNHIHVHHHHHHYFY